MTAPLLAGPGAQAESLGLPARSVPRGKKPRWKKRRNPRPQEVEPPARQAERLALAKRHWLRVPGPE